jgi:hypothetical protein
VIKPAVMPSQKYSCSGSPLRLSNGKTAMDGLFSVKGYFLNRSIFKGWTANLKLPDYQINGNQQHHNCSNNYRRKHQKC